MPISTEDVKKILNTYARSCGHRRTRELPNIRAIGMDAADKWRVGLLMPTLAAEQAMLLADDQSRVEFVRQLSSDLLTNKGIDTGFGRVLHLLQDETLGPLTQVSVAVLSLGIPELEVWGGRTLRECLSVSPDAAAVAWLLIDTLPLNRNAEDGLIPILLDTLPPLTSVFHVGALARLANRLNQRPTGSSIGALASIGTRIVEHLEMLPLGQANDLLNSTYGHPKVPGQLLERALNDKTAPMACQVEESQVLRYPSSLLLTREDATQADIRTTLERLMARAQSSVTDENTNVALAAILTLASTGYAVEAFLERLVGMPGMLASKERCVALQRLLQGLARKQQRYAYLAIGATCPKKTWNVFQEDFLAWLQSPGVTMTEHLKRLKSEHGEVGVRHAFRMSPVSTLETWVTGLRPSGACAAYAAYVQWIAQEHGANIRIRDSVRLLLSLSGDGEARRLGLLLPRLDDDIPMTQSSPSRRPGVA